MPYLSFRPVTAAVLLLAVVMLLIARDRRMGERSAAVWWVIPLTVLMVNVHLFACAVPLYVGVLLLGALWERRGAMEPPDWPEGDRRVRRHEGWCRRFRLLSGRLEGRSRGFVAVTQSNRRR